MSALEGLPSFSEAAFSHTSPQVVYKGVRRIVDRKGPRQAVEPSARSGCPPTLVKHRPLPEVKNILLINGVDPRCKNVIRFNSTDFPLPFLYGDSATSSQKPQPQHQQSPPAPVAGPEPPSRKEGPRERKRPRRDSERRVSMDVAVQPERKRPKRESEGRAEAAARQRRRSQ